MNYMLLQEYFVFNILIIDKWIELTWSEYVMNIVNVNWLLADR